MTEDDYAAMVARVREHEGYRRFPYRDTKGILTIGIGRNLDHVGVDETEAAYLLARDLRRAEAKAAAVVPGFDALDGPRQAAFVELAFNLGAARLAQFTRMLAATAERDWPRAAAELLDSAWATQVQPARRDALHGLILHGRLPGYPADAARRA